MKLSSLVCMLCIQFAISISCVVGLYEDQVGLFDWHKHLTGVPQFIITVPDSSKVVFGTDRKAVAAVDIITGEIAWRRILEADDLEQSGPTDHSLIEAMWLGGQGGRSVAVLASGIVRMFDAESGKLKFELPLTTDKSLIPSHCSADGRTSGSPDRLGKVVVDSDNDFVTVDAAGAITKISLPVSTKTLHISDTPSSIRWRYSQRATTDRVLLLAKLSQSTVIALFAPCAHDTQSGSTSRLSLVELAMEDGAVVREITLDAPASLREPECVLVRPSTDGSAKAVLLCLDHSTNNMLLIDSEKQRVISSGKSVDDLFGTKCGTTTASSSSRHGAKTRRSLQCSTNGCKAAVFSCPNGTPGAWILHVTSAAADGGWQFNSVPLNNAAQAATIMRQPNSAFDAAGNVADDLVVTTGVVEGDGLSVSSTPLSASHANAGTDTPAATTIPHAAAYGTPRMIYMWQMTKLGAKQQFYVIVTELGVVLLLRNNELLWTRHEGLTSIVATTITELPQSESEDLIQDEFISDSSTSPSSKPTRVIDLAAARQNPWLPQAIVQAFVRRVYAQCLQLKHFVFNFQDQITSLLSSQILPGGGKGRAADALALAATSAVPDFRVGSEEKFRKLLHRNKFDTHKLIVVATLSGALYALESRRGTIVWFSPLGSDLQCIPTWRNEWQRTTPSCKYHLFVQRINAPHPFSADNVAIIIGEKPGGTDGQSTGAWRQFNPVTGRFLTSNTEHLPSAIISAGLLPMRLPAEHLQPAFVLDDKLNIFLLPPRSSSAALLDSSSQLSQFIRNDFFLAAIRQSAPTASVQLIGCKPHLLKPGPGDNNSAKCLPLWTHELIGVDDVHASRIVAVGAKLAQEVAYSDARIIADEKLLYKYINPGLLVIVTEIRDIPVASSNTATVASQPQDGGKQSGTTSLHILCIDMITGHVIASNVHKRAAAPVAVVVSENFIVYTYWSERMRNTEVAVLDFYLGERKLAGTPEDYERMFGGGGADADTAAKSGDNDDEANAVKRSNVTFPPTTSPWLSSFVLADYKPMVEQRIYNLRGQVRALAVSLTARGIAGKSLYFALSSGAILELPKLVVDGRRPIVVDAKAREEGLAPYTPELPLVPQQYINYNRSALQVTQLQCAPSGLESTSLFFASGGIDLFFTQLAPSQRFDVLKDDFDYWILILALFTLVAASFISRRMAHRKVLLQVWK